MSRKHFRHTELSLAYSRSTFRDNVGLSGQVICLKILNALLPRNFSESRLILLATKKYDLCWTYRWNIASEMIHTFGSLRVAFAWVIIVSDDVCMSKKVLGYKFTCGFIFLQQVLNISYSFEVQSIDSVKLSC